MEKETLFFEFQDINNNTKFKINFITFYKIISYFIKKKKLKNIPENVLKQLKQKFNINEENTELKIKVIDTFDWKGEKIRAEKDAKEEKEYEEYIKKNR